MGASHNQPEYDQTPSSREASAPIIERTSIEQELRTSNAQLLESQQVARLGFYRYAIATDRWESSEILDEIFGIDRDYHRDLDSWLAIIHPDDRAQLRAYVLNEVVEKRQPFEREYRIVRHSSGTVRWVHGLGQLHVDEAGRIVWMHGTIQDITERKETEEALRISRARLQHLISSTPVIVYACQPSGNYGATFVSPNVVTQLGYRPENFTDDPGFWASHIHP